MARRVKRPVVPVPQNLEEAARSVARIGEAQRAIDGVRSNLNEQVSKLTAEAMESVNLHEENIARLTEGLSAFAEGHRREFKGKTVKVPTGEFGWRKTRKSVELTESDEVIAAKLKARGLTHCFKVVTTVIKTALLKERKKAEGVPGVIFREGGERFFVNPEELEVTIQ